jgi:hypothetical protein
VGTNEAICAERYRAGALRRRRAAKINHCQLSGCLHRFCGNYSSLFAKSRLHCWSSRESALLPALCAVTYYYSFCFGGRRMSHAPANQAESGRCVVELNLVHNYLFISQTHTHAFVLGRQLYTHRERNKVRRPLPSLSRPYKEISLVSAQTTQIL